MARAKKYRTFTLMGGYSRVTLTEKDLQQLDSEYKGGDLEWTPESPTVTVPATTSDALLEELNSQPGLEGTEAAEE